MYETAFYGLWIAVGVVAVVCSGLVIYGWRDW